jgi:electron transport complex protein RnfD
MRHVFLAALPVALFSVYAYGVTALLLLVVATLSCVGTESLLCRLSAKPSTIGDWSAAVTGLLYGLALPPGLPLWMVVVGGIVAIGLGKMLFGGLGSNPFNPALVGRAVLQAAFPVAMTTWSDSFATARFGSVLSSAFAIPFMTPSWDAVSGATPLAAMKFEGESTGTYDLAMGLIGGSTGEASSVLILLGGAYLAARKMLNVRIPLTIFFTVFALSGVFYLLDSTSYPSPGFMLFAGGLVFGAVFMATDMVTSPVTPLGITVYGALIGILVVVIRLWGGLPEGVMYAILFGNACVPILDRLLQPRVYGTSRGRSQSTKARAA